MSGVRALLDDLGCVEAEKCVLFYNAVAPILPFDSLKSARRSITISAFSIGRENSDVKEFFEIIHDKLLAKKQVLIIVNDDENLKKFARDKLLFFEDKFPEFFTVRFFNPKRNACRYYKIF